MPQPQATHAQQKSAIRQIVLARRDSLNPDYRAQASRHIAQQVMNAPFITNIKSGAIISLYWPIRSEVDCRFLFPLLSSLGALLALPRLDQGQMTLRLWQQDAPLEQGSFGLSEPLKDAVCIEPDIILAPLSAWDRSLNRLGYGKGYYDRAINTIETSKTVTVIGLAFAAQEVPHIPQDPHDRKLDALITEKELLLA